VNASDAHARVVVPIHNGHDALARCLPALAATLPPDVPVELVDDASTDPRIAPLLERHARLPRWQVLRQETNLGFVRTVNGAFARTDLDVVLLNSDTIPAGDWYARLLRCARSDPAIATATPFSNHAEICSFPRFCHANPVPGDLDAVARAVAASGSPSYPDLPTGVGFCMVVRRSALARIGDFDAETFGRGYGEENDFCRRAAGHGLRNVLCDDAYVAHVGGQSFGPLGLAPGGENLARLAARYPHYQALVADFIARDPLAPRRAQIAGTLAAMAVAA